jgi:hypothetical protein
MWGMSIYFRDSTLLIQKAEVDWAFADGEPAPFKKDRPLKVLTGDSLYSVMVVPAPLHSGAYTGPSVTFGDRRAKEFPTRAGAPLTRGANHGHLS